MTVRSEEGLVDFVHGKSRNNDIARFLWLLPHWYFCPRWAITMVSVKLADIERLFTIGDPVTPFRCTFSVFMYVHFDRLDFRDTDKMNMEGNKAPTLLESASVTSCGRIFCHLRATM